MKYLLKFLTLFITGGTVYYFIEILWRGYSHYSMFIVGGLALIAIGYINIHLKWSTPLYQQCAIATVVILLLEFVSGCIVNLWLNLGVWDYSQMPFNLLGQIQLYFAVLWYFLSILGILLDDYIRFIFFKEDKPKYKIF